MLVHYFNFGNTLNISQQCYLLGLLLLHWFAAFKVLINHWPVPRVHTQYWNSTSLDVFNHTNLLKIHTQVAVG